MLQYSKLVVIGLVIMALLPLGMDSYTLSVLLVYGILAFSLGLIWGYAGILCFGQAAFFGLGAYSFAIAAINTDSAWAAFFIGMLIPAIFAALLGAMLFYGRLADVYLAVVTLVATLILFKFLNASAGSAYVIGKARLGGFNGIPGFPTLTLPWDSEAYLVDDSLYYFCFACLLIVLILGRFLLQTHAGRVVVAIRENEQRAELMGYDVRLYKTGVFSLSGGIAGLAGVLYANWSEIVTPGLFSLAQSAEVIIWTIVGGVGTLLGPVIGAMILALLKFLLGQQSVINNSMVMGSLLIIAVLWLPHGVWPAIISGGRRVMKWVGGGGGGTARRTRSARQKDNG